MNIKWKFAVFTIAVCSISLLSSVTLWLYQKNEINAAMEQKGKEIATRIEKVLVLKSGYYRKQANDYAYWNDLVKYVHTKDTRWAKDNLDGSLDEFGSNGVYVIGVDKSIVYSSVDKAFLRDLYRIIDKNSFNANEQKETHFYAKTADGIVEFFGAPIRHSTKIDKTKATYGYFLVAKHWDAKYISEIEQLGHIEAEIEESPSENIDDLKNKISKNISLRDISGNQIGFLHITTQNEIAKALDDYALNSIEVELAYIIIIVAAFIFLMTRYSTVPLMDISKALKLNDVSPIRKYLSENNEYGNIGRAINESFENKSRLQELNAKLELRVTEEVEKNRQKDQALFQQSKNAALGELISLIAHQWRQPLNALGLVLQTAYSDYKDGSLVEKDMENCNTKGMQLINSMSQTINSFRSFFLPTQEKQTFCIESSIDASVNIISALFESAGIKINRHYFKQHEFFGYKGEFEHAILNLLLNARDAIDACKIKDGIVEIFVTEKTDILLVEIIDNGGGIKEDILDEIFNPYITTKHQAHGVGTGLYMSKQIIEKHHGGKISANNLQTGARFAIELPLVNNGS